MKHLLITLLLLATISMAGIQPIPQDLANHGLLSATEYVVLKPIVGTRNAYILTIGTMAAKELTDPIFSYEDIVYGLFGLGLVTYEVRF